MICFRACYSISIQLLRPRKISRPSSRGTHLALDNFPELKSKNSGSVSFLPWGTSSHGQCGFDTILTCEMFFTVSRRRSRHVVSPRIRFLCMPDWLRSVEALDRLSKHPSRALSGTQQPSTSSALYGLKAVAALSSSRSPRKCKRILVCHSKRVLPNGYTVVRFACCRARREAQSGRTTHWRFRRLRLATAALARSPSGKPRDVTGEQSP